MAIPAKLKARLKKIRCLILDVDGVMTDARIIWIEGAGWTAFYNVRDGFGMRQLMKNGIQVGMISGGAFNSHKERAKVLGVQHAFFGNEDKLEAYATIKNDLGLKDEQIAYVGDELFDMPVLAKVGFAATVPEAPDAVKKICHYVTKNSGGHGAVREICNFLLELNGFLK